MNCLFERLRDCLVRDMGEDFGISEVEDYEGGAIRSIWVPITSNIRMSIYVRQSQDDVSAILRPVEETSEGALKFKSEIEEYNERGLVDEKCEMRKWKDQQTPYAWLPGMIGSGGKISPSETGLFRSIIQDSKKAFLAKVPQILIRDTDPLQTNIAEFTHFAKGSYGTNNTMKKYVEEL